MVNAVIVIAAVVLLGGLLHYEKEESQRGKLLTKTPLSLLFIVAVLVQPVPEPVYFHFVLVALILCLFGDVFLAFNGPRTFLFGLISFLLGHVLYVFAFLRLAGLSHWSWPGPLVVVIVSAGVFFWLLPHLGSMKIPVLAYVLVISVMLSASFAVFTRPEISRTGAFMVFLGALLFYLSDLFVARDRFVRPGFTNRRYGLPMYYGGQFLLAFSVGLVF